MGWSKKYKKSIDCNNPKGFSQKAHCAGRKKQESKMSLKLEELVGKRLTEEQFDEAAGKKDACYHKVKARYDVWPSAYASGALVKCRKVGAKNWGNKSKKEGLGEVSDVQKRKIYKKAFGKEYDDSKRKQTPLPLDIAYKVALNKLKKKEGVYEKNKGKTLYGKDLVNYFVKRFKYSTRDATAVANKLKDVGFKVPKVLPFNESVNEGDIESRELKLYIDNDSQLYNSRFMPIMKNLSKKMKKGNFDKKLAIKGFMYLVDDGAKKYVKDFGGNAKEMFSKKDRIAVASDLADEFEDAYKNKEYSFMENINEAGFPAKLSPPSSPKVKKAQKVWMKKYMNPKGGPNVIKLRKDGRPPFPTDRNYDELIKRFPFLKEGKEKMFPSAKVDAAVKLAKRMGGNMTNAVKKIEKMAKGLSKNGRVQYALRKANESINEGRVLHFTQIKDKTLEKHLKVIAKKVGATVSKISGGFKVDADNDGRKLAQVVDYIFDKSLMKGLMSGGGMSRVQLVNENSDSVIDEGLGDMIGKSIGKYNKKRKKNMDALKKLKKKESVEEAYDIWMEDGSFGYTFTGLVEAEYQGRKVKLGKPMQGDVKKFKVYVKNPKGNVVKVNFGQGGGAKGGTMKIRKSNPKARANFRARHNCDNPGPRHKARYWSCRKW